jgi:hypothetical protein
VDDRLPPVAVEPLEHVVTVRPPPRTAQRPERTPVDGMSRSWHRAVTDT